MMSSEALKQASSLLKALSHPTRLRLATYIMSGEASVAEMERELNIRQPSLSQHLGELREAGLVSTRREHKVVFYTLTDPRAIDLLADLLKIFGGKLERRPHRQTSAEQHLHGSAAMFAIVKDVT